MDEIDKGQEREQELREQALAYRKPAGPAPCGECHNCGEPLDSTAQFCGHDCRDDFEKRNRR